MSGRTCAGTWVRGRGKDGQPRSTYLYHVVDNETTMREYGSQAVVWQTAINPVVALELLDSGEWKGTGVLGPEAFPPAPVPRAARRAAAHRTGRWSCPPTSAAVGLPPRRAHEWQAQTGGAPPVVTRAAPRRPPASARARHG